MGKEVVELGDKVKCKITEFEGIVCAIAKHLTGCDRADVRPSGVDKDGKLKEGYWFDVNALAILKKQVVKAKDVQDERPDKKGGPPSRAR